MREFHLHKSWYIMTARTVTYPHHTSPRYRFFWIFKDFSICWSRCAAHRRRNKSISSQRLPHSRIYSSYVSHTRLLKSVFPLESERERERERISRVLDARPGHESSLYMHVWLLFRRCLFCIAVGRHPLVFFHACYTRCANWLVCLIPKPPWAALELAGVKYRPHMQLRARTLPITCGSQLRIN